MVTELGTAARSWSVRVTVTVSASGAMVSDMFTTADPPAATVTVAASPLKPGSALRTSYRPAGRPPISYRPWPLLTAVRTPPVPVMLTVTVTPGNTPPLSSAIVPLMVPRPWPAPLVDTPMNTTISIVSTPRTQTRFLVRVHTIPAQLVRSEVIVWVPVASEWSRLPAPTALGATAPSPPTPPGMRTVSVRPETRVCGQDRRSVQTVRRNPDNICLFSHLGADKARSPQWHKRSVYGGYVDLSRQRSATFVRSIGCTWSDSRRTTFPPSGSSGRGPGRPGRLRPAADPRAYFAALGLAPPARRDPLRAARQWQDVTGTGGGDRNRGRHTSPVIAQIAR